MAENDEIKNRLSALRDSVDGKKDATATAETIINRIDDILVNERNKIAIENAQKEQQKQADKNSSGIVGIFTSAKDELVDMAGADSKLGHIIADTSEATYEGSKIVRSVIKTLVWFWYSFLFPVIRYLFAPAATWIITKYTRLYNRLAYTKDKKTGEERINYPRSLATIIASFIIGYWLLTSAIPFLGHLAYEATLYPTTLRKETMIMMGSEAAATKDGVFYAKGCNNLSQCDDTHSIRYEIRHSNWLYFKNLFTKGQLFLPEYIDGAIPNVIARCELETWGFRFRPLGLYPQISSVKRCVPLSDDEIQELNKASPASVNADI